jgi:hypothetical protein
VTEYKCYVLLTYIFLRLNRKERLFLDYLDFNNYVILEGLGGA